MAPIDLKKMPKQIIQNVMKLYFSKKCHEKYENMKKVILHHSFHCKYTIISVTLTFNI